MKYLQKLILRRKRRGKPAFPCQDILCKPVRILICEQLALLIQLLIDIIFRLAALRSLSILLFHVIINDHNSILPISEISFHKLHLEIAQVIDRSNRLCSAELKMSVYRTASYSQTT